MNTMAWIPLLSSILAGCLTVSVAIPPGAVRISWLRNVLILFFGIAAGAGLTSFVFFLLLWSGVASPAAVFVSDAVTIAGLLLASRRVRAVLQPLAPPPFAGASIWLIAFLIAGLLTAFAAIWNAVNASPHGQWDAFSIWNLKAKYLAGPGESWRIAVARELSLSHPDYPLLLPVSVARSWLVAGETSPLVPAVWSAVFFYALIGTVFCALYLWRGSVAASLAGLLLLSNSSFLLQASAQYADIPLALYITGALAATMLGLREPALTGSPVLGGFFLACAAWTKNEGLAFAVVALVSMPLVLRALDQPLTPALRLFLGALPGLAIVGVFKVFVAPSGDLTASQSWPVMIARVTDISRYQEVALAFFEELVHLGQGLAHPLLLVAALAVGLGVRRDAVDRPAVVWCAVTLLLQFAAYMGVYILLSNDLKWHLETSLGRLLVHLWPGALMTLLLLLRWPEAPPAPNQQARKSRRRT